MAPNQSTKFIAFCLTFLAVSIFVLYVLVLSTPTTPPIQPELSKDLVSNEQNNINTFRKTSKSVVFVTNSQLRRNAFSLNFQEIPSGAGTGVVWSKNGLIITNFHVVKNASKVIVTLWDQSSWPAIPVGVAPYKDLAVLKIDAPEKILFPLGLGDSKKLEVGHKVLAIGNPFGLDTTLTVGVVSALGREIEVSGNKIKDLIQTDTAINPGNSGGPLLNSKGELVGINTLIYSPSGASSGVGFAIPVNTVKRIIPQLIKYGRIMRPSIGIHPLPDNIALRLGVQGVIIHEVIKNTPAFKARLTGIRKDRGGNLILGDIIIKIDQYKINNFNDLLTALESFEPGDDVILQTIRDKQLKKFKLQLGAPSEI